MFLSAQYTHVFSKTHRENKQTELSDKQAGMQAGVKSERDRVLKDEYI